MDYIVALQEYLKNDDDINTIVGDRIGFLRMAEGTEKPCIVFNEQEWSAENFANPDYRAGVDIFPVLIDVVVGYESTIIGRQLRMLIREKIGSFCGKLSTEREGTIIFQRFLSADFSAEADAVIWGGLYLFKTGYDNTNN